MRIGIDARHAHLPGIGRYIEELVTHLARVEETLEFVIFTLDARLRSAGHAHYQQPQWQDAFDHPNIHVVPFAAKTFSLREQLQFRDLMRQARIDVFHSTFINVPLCSRVPLVVTLHDIRHPDLALHWGSSLPRAAAKALYHELMTRHALRHAQRVIAVSDFLRVDAARFALSHQHKVRTIHHGVSALFTPDVNAERDAAVREQYATGMPYFLFVGTLKPHKNLLTLLRAFAQVRRQFKIPHRLLIAAKQDARYPQPGAAVQRLGIAADVRFMDHVAKQDLPALYRGARGVVLPSFYESFGLPIIEAMACGAPVITSNLAAMPEIAGDAGLLIDPSSAQSLAAALLRLANDDDCCETMRSKGLVNARRFSWARSAAQHAALYRELSTTAQT
ncbi:MAG: glycosyltransferase family 4 protein [Gammaproteobacteria bacterium]